MEPIYDRDRVLVYDDGGTTPRATVIEWSREYLLGKGFPPVQVDDALIDSDGLVVRAWWGGESVGFAYEGYPGAIAVSVLNLPMGFRSA